MHFTTLAIAAMATGLVAAVPQGVATTLPPPSSPTGCASTYINGDQFQIGLVDVTASDKVKRQGLDPNAVPGHILLLTLDNGQLKDQVGRIGYIASNSQLQFDNPIQAGATITEGWSVCPNGTLALETAVWWQCLSVNPNNNETFYNLYTGTLGSQCSPAYIDTVPYTNSSSSAGASATTATSTGTGASTTGKSSGTTTIVPLVTTNAPTTTGEQTPSATSASVTATNPNAATAIFISGDFFAVAAGVVALGAFFL